MADQDYDDEELFADLYTDDAPSNPPQNTADAATTEPEPAAVPDNVPAATHDDASAYAGGDVHIAANGDQVNGVEAYDSGYGGQQLLKMEDEDAPIGIKEDGKMFIGGLNWETTDESLKNYFSQFGKVVECTVMRDSATGRSRGFGFLTFEDPKVVNTVMVKEHYLDGKIIDPKRAIPREEQERTAKIFVGGVHHDARENEFRDFFRQFGRVIDATLMMDKDTGHPRGFGFVTFDGEDAVERTLAQPLAIRGKPIEVKRAEPRGNMHDDGGRGKFGKRDRFGRDSSQDMAHGGQQAQGQMAGAQGDQNMSPSLMAKYWFMMQQYFQNMQQRMAMQLAQGQGQMGPGGMPGMPGMPGMGPGMGQMTPQMMQQMMASRMQGTNSPSQGMPGMPGGMDAAMMQQMQQQMMGQGSPQGGSFGGMGAGGPGEGGFNGQEQNVFEQRKFEQQQAQQAARMAQQQFAAQQGSFAGPGGPTSWEGMYDDVPQPAPPPTGPRQAGPIRGHQQGRGHQKGPHQQTPPAGPSNAPANAPTGPKNAGKPGANYRPGARGGRRFNPY